MIAFFIRVIILNLRPFQSDESVYVYASYAITRGVVPYRQIYLAHPPLMYAIYSGFIRLVGPDFIRIRLLNVVVHLLTIFLTYIMVRMLLKNQKGNRTFALLSAAIYAFYPSYFLLISTTSLLENVLTLLTLGGVIAYIAFQGSKNKWLSFIAGVLMGLALITTLRAVLFVMSIVLFHVISCLWGRKYKALFTDIASTLIGVLIPVLVVVLAAVYWQALPQLYSQLVYRQMIRPYVERRLFHAFWYINSMFPLIVTGVLGAIYSARIAKKEKKSSLVLPICVFGVSFIAMLFAFRNTFFHYFFYLNPYLVFLSVMCFLQVRSVLTDSGPIKTKVRLDQNLTVLSIFLVLLILLSSLKISNFTEIEIPYFRQTPYNSLHSYVGNSVAMLTNPADKIWTSEGAISFFAQRLIVAPSSNSWPVQGFFSSMLGSTSYGSQKHYEEALLTTEQFVEVWEKEKVKVIVFIRGSGWVPYPDELLWNGFQGQEGVANFIEGKYELNLVVRSTDAPYSYFVWMRR
jgi:4-amino-4-deoxy-L-arabinose transferase-like glycosyltransferase